jgi:hypothetical protein
VLSKDGKYVAFILEKIQGGVPRAQIYIMTLDDLMKESNRLVSEVKGISANSYTRVGSSSRRSSTASSSTSSTNSSDFLGSQSFQLPFAVSNIYDFCFSDANVLYAVSRPPATRTGHKIVVFAWTLETSSASAWKLESQFKVSNRVSNKILLCRF